MTQKRVWLNAYSFRLFSKNTKEDFNNPNPSILDPFGTEGQSSQSIFNSEKDRDAEVNIGETQEEGFLPNLMTEQDLAGITSFKEGIQQLKELDFENAAKSFKIALKEIKASGLDKSSSYLYALNRLAYANLKLSNFKSADKYYKITEDMLKLVPDLENNGFMFYENLLNFYMKTDFERAEKLISRMIDLDFSGETYKRILFCQANLSWLKEDYSKAIEGYQTVIKMSPNLLLKGQVLNNLAMANIYRYTHEAKLDKLSSDAETGYNYVITNFKESIKTFESLPSSATASTNLMDNKQIKEDMISLIWETDQLVPENYNPVLEDKYLGYITNRHSGKVITNLCELLLTKKGVSPVAISFWFKIGLSLYKNHAPNDISRHALLLATFYSANGDLNTAHMLFRNTLATLPSDNSYLKIFGLNMYGRLLLKSSKTEHQGLEFVKLSEKIAQSEPSNEKLESLFMEDTEINPFQ